MQKHEKEVLQECRAVAEEAGWPVTVSTEPGHGPKMKLVVTGPKGRRTKPISSSPKSNAAEVGFARRWLRRTVGEVL